MARAGDGRSALVELKAVDGAYPLFGAADARTGDADLPICWPNATAAFGAAADPALLARLDLKLGDRVTHRQRDACRSAASSTAEPDKLAGGLGFGPRFLISEAGLRATGLLQPGSLVRWHLPGAAAGRRRRAIAPPTALIDDAQAAVAASRLGNPHPQQRLAAARAQRRAASPNS